MIRADDMVTPDEGDTNQEVSKPIVFDEVNDAPLLYANAFLLQGSDDPHAFVLNVGQYAIPILSGTDEERAEILRNLPVFHARTLTRLVLTPDKLTALANVLAQAAEMIAKQQQAAQKEDGGKDG